MAAFGDRLVHRDEPTEPRMPRVPNFSRLSIVGVALSSCTTVGGLIAAWTWRRRMGGRQRRRGRRRNR